MSNTKCPICRQELTKELIHIYGIEISTSCSICLNIFDKPMVCQCGHVFCEECSKSLDISVKNEYSYLKKEISDLKNKINSLQISSINRDIYIDNIVRDNMSYKSSYDFHVKQINDLKKDNYDYRNEIDKLRKLRDKLKKENMELFDGKDQLYNKYIDLLKLYNEEKQKNSILSQENKILSHENETLEKLLIQEEKYSNILPKPVQIPKQRKPAVPFELLDPPTRHNFTEFKLKRKFKNPFSEDT
jgi:FtsZ-binding cell division protein ZapB